jgi:glycosyltransferase involved in cell wall biosynthesis
MKSLTVVIPTLNEAEGIAEVINNIPKDELKKLGYSTKVVIVDCNSTDGTQAIAKKLGATVINEPRRGYGRAYRTAFEKVKSDVIITTDADSSYPTEEITRLVKIFDERELDFLVAARLFKYESGAHTNLSLNKLSNLFIFFVYGIMFSDSQSGMWVIRREKLAELNLKCDGWPFSPEIKIEAVKKKLKFMEVPIFFKVRKGTAKLNGMKGAIENTTYLLKKRLGLN